MAIASVSLPPTNSVRFGIHQADILIAEAKDSDSKHLKTLLEGARYTVQQNPNPVTAAAQIATRGYKLLITSDFLEPVASQVKFLLETARNNGIPYIFLTRKTPQQFPTSPLYGDAAQGHIIHKPFQANELLKTVGQQVNRLA
jgi:DNA-binding NtrC family response regulator